MAVLSTIPLPRWKSHHFPNILLRAMSTILLLHDSSPITFDGFFVAWLHNTKYFLCIHPRLSTGRITDAFASVWYRYLICQNNIMFWYTLLRSRTLQLPYCQQFSYHQQPLSVLKSHIISDAVAIVTDTRMFLSLLLVDSSLLGPFPASIGYSESS